MTFQKPLCICNLCKNELKIFKLWKERCENEQENAKWPNLEQKVIIKKSQLTKWKLTVASKGKYFCCLNHSGGQYERVPTKFKMEFDVWKSRVMNLRNCKKMFRNCREIIHRLKICELSTQRECSAYIRSLLKGVKKLAQNWRKSKNWRKVKELASKNWRTEIWRKICHQFDDIR